MAVQDIFKQLLSDIFTEYYKPKGWKKQGSNFRYFDNSGLGKIINFQKSSWNTASNMAFYINYGFYMEADDHIEYKTFKEHECNFRARTRYLTGCYRMSEHTDYEVLKRNILTALKEADTLFDRIDSKQIFIRKILDGSLKKETQMPVMIFSTCKVLSEMGYHKEVYEHIKDTKIESFASLREEIEMKMQNLD